MKHQWLVVPALMLALSACVFAATGFTTTTVTRWPRPYPHYQEKDPMQLWPQIATNGSTFLVIWSEQFYVYSNTISSPVYAARYSASGILLDPDGIRVVNDTFAYNELQNPAVCAAGQDYWVLYGLHGYSEFVYARSVHANGTLGAPLLVGEGSGAETIKDLHITALPGGNLLAVWCGASSGQHFTIFTPGGGIVVHSQPMPNGINRPVFAVANNYVLGVGFTGPEGNSSTIEATRMTATGATADPQPIRIDAAMAYSPVDVIPYRSGWLITYLRDSQIHGRYLDEQGQVSTDLFAIETPWISTNAYGGNHRTLALCATTDGFALAVSAEEEYEGNYFITGYPSLLKGGLIFYLDTDFHVISQQSVPSPVQNLDEEWTPKMDLTSNAAGVVLAVWKHGDRHVVWFDSPFKLHGGVVSPGPSISYQPECLSFMTAAGGPNPVPQSLLISPASTTGTLQWSASANVPWLTLTPTHGSASVKPNTITVSVNSAGFAPGEYRALITLTATAVRNSPQTIPVTLTVAPVASFPFQDDFSTDKGWSGYTAGQWERGPAIPYGGDPSHDHTPTADDCLLGFNIGGPFPNYMSACPITSPAIDCSQTDKVVLSFWRWLSIGYRDDAVIQVSIDGNTWAEVWQSHPQYFNPTDWEFCEYDLSSIAARQPRVFLRFVLGPTDIMLLYTGGWSIDDVILGTGTTVPGMAVEPEVLDFTKYIYGPSIPTKTLTIRNTGTGTLNWTVATDMVQNGTDWLHLNPLTGASSGEADAVTASISTYYVVPTVFIGTITVASPDLPETHRTVSVRFTSLDAGFQPDLQIKSPSDIAYRGIDFFYRYPCDQQTCTQHTINTGTVIYHLNIKNTAHIADDIILDGNGGRTGWTVRYYDALTGGTEITDAVVSGSWHTGALAPGAAKAIRLEVTPNATVVDNARLDTRVSATAVMGLIRNDLVLARTIKDPVPYQPDLMLRTPATSTFTGDNLYNLDGVNQSATQFAPAGTTCTYYVRIQNDSPAADSFTIRCPAGGADWTLRCYDAATGGNDISAQMTGGGWLTPVLLPGEVRDFRLEVRPNAAVANGTARDVQVLAVSMADPAKTDMVTARTVRTSLSAVRLQTVPLSPQPINRSITLTAVPTGGDAVQYKFRVGYLSGSTWAWSILRDYATVATCTWTPTIARSYLMQAWAREAGIPACQLTSSLSFVVTRPLSAVTLLAQPAGACPLNRTFTLLATPTGGANVEFLFRAGYCENGHWTWQTLRAYNRNRLCTAQLSAARAYTLVVWAREVGSGVPYQQAATIPYRITPPLSGVRLAAQPASPQPARTRVTLTATPTGGANVQYKFRLGWKDGATWQWMVLRDYSASPTYSWTPTAAHQYTVVVWAREPGSTSQYETTALLGYTVSP